MTIHEIAEKIDANIIGDGGISIHGIAKIEEADAGEITFIANQKYEKYLDSTRASAVIISKKIDVENLPRRETPPVVLQVDDPYVAFLFVLRMFNPPPEVLPPGIHPTAVIPESVRLADDVRIGAHVVLGENCSIGARRVVAHSTILGDNVRIGEDTTLYPNITVREGCRIGARVIIHSGTVVGSDGFGFAPQKDGTYSKIPQTGIVVIDDDVEIGSNCSIDRATMGETRIGKGVKLDNLIQVAHNVTIGDNTVIAAQTGISGSTKVGKQCILAGQVGIVGHVEIADNVTIAAQSGIPKSIKKSGTYFGYPAKEFSRSLRIEAVIRNLPELMNDVQNLNKELERIKNKSEDTNSSQE